MYTGVSVRFAEQNYSVTEGSDVIIVILADKPANKSFSVLLTTITTQSTTAASGIAVSWFSFYYYSYVSICLVTDFINLTSEVTFGPNQTEAHAFVHAQEDLLLETNEEFIVKLELMEEDRMIGIQLREHYDSATVTIINDNGIQHLCLVFIQLHILFIIVAIHVGLIAMEYFTIEDSAVMSVVLESDQPAYTTIVVTLQLTTNTASGN